MRFPPGGPPESAGPGVPGQAPSLPASGPRLYGRGLVAELSRNVMGVPAVEFVNALGFPLADPLDPDTRGALQRFTPTIEALVTPDVDEALDDQAAKTAFWKDFKALGPWWAEQPPY